MATENAVMAAVLAEGETVIGNAACEPHVQDLCRFLVSLGAQIEGIGSNVLRIQGVERAARRRVARSAPTTSRSASFIGLAAVTGGDITIEDVGPDDLISILPAFERLGVRVEIGGRACASRPASSSSSRTTSAARSRRSRTARGPRSPPT